jgi:hypothetical protein
MILKHKPADCGHQPPGRIWPIKKLEQGTRYGISLPVSELHKLVSHAPTVPECPYTST